MPDIELHAARQVAERVRHAFAAATIEGTDGQLVSATLSTGVAQLPDGTEAADALMELVSKELLQAKERGRNRIEPQTEARPLQLSSGSVGASQPPARVRGRPLAADTAA